MRKTDTKLLSARDQALLVELADGTLAGRRRSRAERRLSDLPNGGELVERQQRVALALRAGPAVTPRVRAAAVRSDSWRRVAHRRPRLALVVAGPAVLAAVAFVLVTAIWGGAPTLAQAAELAARPAERVAPTPRAGTPLLAAEHEGVPFPDWSSEFGWHAVGARDDTLDDRTTRTVFYEHMGHRIGYTIVSGDALELPPDAERVRAGGVEIALLRAGDRDIAVFVRDGHTCVLAGHVLERATLVELAAWQARGAVEF